LDQVAPNESPGASRTKFKSGVLEAKGRLGQQNATQGQQAQVHQESRGPTESFPGGGASLGRDQSYFGDTQNSLHSHGYSQALAHPLDAASLDGGRGPEENVLGGPDETAQSPTKF